MDEPYDGLIASDGGSRRRWRGRRIVAILVSVVMSATGSIASSVPAAATTQWTCPPTAKKLYQLTVDDSRLDREAAKVGVCGDLLDTFLVINNTSSQPILFWSATPGSTYQNIEGDASLAVREKNVALRQLLRGGRSDSYILAGEAMRVTGRSVDFGWEFDASLTMSTLATDVAAALAVNKLKRWASSGSKTKAAVMTCAFAATSAGATAQDMDDVMTQLLLGATPCAAAVESAGTNVKEETLLQRANTLQSKLATADSFVKKVELANVIGEVLRRGVRR